MSKLPFFGFVVAIVFQSVLLFERLALAANVLNVNVPFAGVDMNDCNGHMTNVAGNAHVVADETQSANSGLHVVLHLNLDSATAVDQVTGETCRTQNNNEALGGAVFNTSPGAVTEYTSEGRGSLECPGPSDDGLFHYVFHVTVDANGDVTASVSDFTFLCK